MHSIVSSSKRYQLRSRCYQRLSVDVHLKYWTDAKTPSAGGLTTTERRNGLHKHVCLLFDSFTPRAVRSPGNVARQPHHDYEPQSLVIVLHNAEWLPYMKVIDGSASVSETSDPRYG